jgi:GNAT superfamily N-acetyltransferase
MNTDIPDTSLLVHPVTPDRWSDLETLFGPQGAYGGCWCMWWRIKRSDFARQQGEGNRLALKAIVEAGEVPGLLAYADGEPVGWCSVGPREAYPTLNRSPVLKRVDGQPVWSVVCFFVAPAWRGRGVMTRLLAAALDYAREHGAKIVEGYPKDAPGRTPDPSAFTGLMSTFLRAGFVEVARRSTMRPIMRLELK